MKHITQGSIIYRMFSEKYEEFACYAIIISARCDIDNDKVSKLYYLTAVDAVEWLLTKRGFETVCKEMIQQKKKCFDDRIKKYNLNSETLFAFEKEEAFLVLNSSETNDRRRKELVEEFESVYNYVNSSDMITRQRLLTEKKKKIIEFFRNIERGVINHFLFIPNTAYKNTEEITGGLMVDLQEIGIMSISDANEIYRPGIDYKLLLEKDNATQHHLTKTYWLRNDSDFVEIIGVVKSPWCELLMQRFTNDFARIGVDGATQDDYEGLMGKVDEYADERDEVFTV